MRGTIKLIALIFLTAVVLEMGARIFWSPVYVDAELYRSADASYGFGFEFPQPLCHEIASEFVCFPTQYRKIPLQHMDRNKSSAETRIATIGGSMSAGNESYPVVLEQLLNEGGENGNRRWKSLNFSVPGYGSARMLAVAREVVKYDPDLVILDPTGTNEFEDERDLARRIRLNSGLGTILYKSQFMVLLKKKVLPQWRRENDKRGPTEEEEGLNPVNQERWMRGFRHNLAAMAQLFRSKGIRVVYMARPRVEIDDRFRTINDIIREFADESNFFDSHSVLHEYAGAHGVPVTSFFKVNQHLEPDGHRVIAAELARFLKSHIAIAGRGLR